MFLLLDNILGDAVNDIIKDFIEDIIQVSNSHNGLYLWFSHVDAIVDATKHVIDQDLYNLTL